MEVRSSRGGEVHAKTPSTIFREGEKVSFTRRVGESSSSSLKWTQKVPSDAARKGDGGGSLLLFYRTRRGLGHERGWKKTLGFLHTRKLS